MVPADGGDWSTAAPAVRWGKSLEDVEDVGDVLRPKALLVLAKRAGVITEFRSVGDTEESCE